MSLEKSTEKIAVRNGIHFYTREVFLCEKHGKEGRESIGMENLKKLPVGFDDFKKIRENQFYYVDKTKLI